MRLDQSSLAAFTALVLSLGGTAALQAAETAYVRRLYAAVHDSRSLPRQLVAKLPQNTTVTVVGTVGQWAQVSLADGRTGWMEALALDDDPVSTGGFLASAGRMTRQESSDVTGTAGGKGVGPVTKEYAQRQNAVGAMQDVEHIEQIPYDVQALDAFMQEGGVGAHRSL